MDFVDWCGVVLRHLSTARRASPTARSLGLVKQQIVEIVVEENPGTALDALATEHAVISALTELERAGLVTHNFPSWKLTTQGIGCAGDALAIWSVMCARELEPEQQHVLEAVNRLSSISGTYMSTCDWIDDQQLLAILGIDSPDAVDLLMAIGEELGDAGLLQWTAFLGREFTTHTTYEGLVWETRRGFVGESRWIDERVAEWETTSVDFKRELYTGTADQKAELIKDMLGLANTQASGRRWLLIGFDDKTRAYHGPPDPKLSQNHLEQLMATYTEPIVSMRYDVVDYRAGKVGRIEVLHDPAQLPYRVAKAIGDKKRVVDGQIFVRHGSQTEPPTPAEEKALLDEGKRAKIR